ncbi:MAG TPA: hypothetical protein VEL77_05065 [Rugosimonospora sp.]|jgi:hypothetical protein|nr:hypothetical protein [Rugosimonospora sp.]
MIAFPRCFLLLFAALVLLCLAGRAQDGAAILSTRIPQCAVRSVDGSWIPKELYADGVLRFTYLYEPPKKNPGEYDYRDETHNVYAAFWNRTRTKGELLQFVWLRRAPPVHLRIVNNGHIVTQQGKMDIEDALWGVWTHEHLTRRLARLRTAPLQTAAFQQIPTRGATCDSYAHAVDDSPRSSPSNPR